jgi:hypothetical protein
MSVFTRGAFTDAKIESAIKAPGGAVIDPAKTSAADVRQLLKDLRDSAAFLSEVLTLAGGTLTGDLILPSSVSTDLQRAISMADALNLMAGWSWKTRCRVATTGNLDLSAPGATIDGVTLSLNNRVLVKNQTAQSQNGIYLWKGASAAMVRASDADTWDELVSATVSVAEGTANADNRYTCTIDDGGTLGTNVVIWANTSAGASYLNGTGLDLVGNIFSVLFATSAEGIAGTNTVKAINAAVLAAVLADWKATTTPLMASGAGSVGSGNHFALANHVHPVPVLPQTYAKGWTTLTVPATTAETVLVMITIPANTLAEGTLVEFFAQFGFTGSTNVKYCRLRVSNSSTFTGGESLLSIIQTTGTTQITAKMQFIGICRASGTNALFSHNNTVQNGGTSNANNQTATLDYTQPIYFFLTGKKDSSGETLVNEFYALKLNS